MPTAESENLARRMISQTAIWFGITAALLFLSAGTLDWPEAWIFLGLWIVLGLTSGLSLARTNPEIIKERMRPPLQQQEQKAWDRPLVIAIFGGWAALHVVAGLDAKRLAWSDMPVWLEIAGGIAFVLGIAIFHLVMRENAYASTVVKVDTERGHKVISTGPYAWVRHPMYTGATLYFLGGALLLGSWWAFIVGLALIAVMAVRAVGEERMLTAELAGYADYARRVKYRLVPGVW
jgi:protein-S-isoprenylcysteine O-methyltransferase Ste14